MSVVICIKKLGLTSSVSGISVVKLGKKALLTNEKQRKKNTFKKIQNRK